MNRHVAWFYKPLIVSLLFLFLSSYAAKSLNQLDVVGAVGDYPLSIETYFQGHSTAYGTFFDRSDTPTRHFVVEIEGDWDEATQTLMLTEDFVFSDGEVSQRIWTFVKTAENQYRGVANDVVGEAQARVIGNTMEIRYVMALPYKNRVLHVKVHDWLFLNADSVLNNKTVMSKYGFKLGEAIITFRKENLINE